MKWNRNAKTTQIKANDKETKTENAENLNPLENIRKSSRNSKTHPKSPILTKILLK